VHVLAPLSARGKPLFPIVGKRPSKGSAAASSGATAEEEQIHLPTPVYGPLHPEVKPPKEGRDEYLWQDQMAEFAGAREWSWVAHSRALAPAKLVYDNGTVLEVHMESGFVGICSAASSVWMLPAVSPVLGYSVFQNVPTVPVSVPKSTPVVPASSL
jgi:hypothetical protein